MPDAAGVSRWCIEEHCGSGDRFRASQGMGHAVEKGVSVEEIEKTEINGQKL